MISRFIWPISTSFRLASSSSKCQLLINLRPGLRLANAEAAIDIDARPSDAIALAVRAKCPVFMAERVLREAGIVELDD
jgi:hypothetical protein